MITAAWHMLPNGEYYRDLGADYYTRQEPTKTKARAIKQLEALGYQVTINPSSKPASHHAEPRRNRASVALNHVTYQHGHQPWSPNFHVRDPHSRT